MPIKGILKIKCQGLRLNGRPCKHFVAAQRVTRKYCFSCNRRRKNQKAIDRYYRLHPWHEDDFMDEPTLVPESPHNSSDKAFDLAPKSLTGEFPSPTI